MILKTGMLTCMADTIIKAMAKRGVESLHSLKAVSNNAGAGPYGLAELVQNGQLTSVILSFLGTNKAIEKKYLSGELDVELTPQGTIAERIRAGGAGIPAFYTPTGVHTWIETGEIPIRMGPPKEGSKMPTTLQPGNRRETREFKGKKFNLEHAIQGDVAILRAYKVDEAGNCVFRYTTGNFGPMMAKAAACSIVEAEHIVPIGEIKPDEVDLPGIYIDRIVPATEEKKLEVKKLREVEGGDQSNKSEGEKRRERIARRAAKELKQGYYVNLGVGMPTLAPSFLDPKIKVWIEEEVDVDIINAGKETVTILPGGSTFDSAESFAMIRGGHIDVSMLGALQVSANGDLANYMIPGKVLKGMGGAMDLVSNPDQTKIVVLTDHVDKNGVSKIQQECSLPLTGARCVSTIITELVSHRLCSRSSWFLRNANDCYSVSSRLTVRMEVLLSLKLHLALASSKCKKRPPPSSRWPTISTRWSRGINSYPKSSFACFTAIYSYTNNSSSTCTNFSRHQKPKCTKGSFSSIMHAYLVCSTFKHKASSKASP